MKYRKYIVLGAILVGLVFLYNYLPISIKTTKPPVSTTVPTTTSQPSIPGLTTPPDFTITYFAQEVTGARSLARNPSGTLIFVGTRSKNLYALVDQNKDGVSDKTVTIRSDLDTPNGVAYKDGALYVAEIGRIIRFNDIDSNYDHNPAYEVVYDQLPKEKYHGWKYLAFGPDGLLYIPIGAPCNVCEDQGRYSRIITLDVNTKEVKTFATGIRNTVGFDWNPSDNTLWFTDNGRDLLGDNTPPDELNHAPKSGLNFGFPRCFGKNVHDPKFGTQADCLTQTAPSVELGPHVAALGIKFYNGDLFPNEYQNKIIIAEHGSWNRRDPIGYRLTLVDPATSTYSDFVTGWLIGDEAWGRPVDILELNDGSLLISDDLNHSVYRLSYMK